MGKEDGGIMQEVEMISCRVCGKPMPKLRLTKFGYAHCVNCSTEKPKVAMTTVNGSGDHTWNDIVVMDQDTAKELAEQEARMLGKKIHLEFLDYDSDDLLEVSESRSKRARNYMESIEDQEDLEEVNDDLSREVLNTDEED